MCALMLVAGYTANAQLSNGLKAYYPFSGNSNDQSGNSHNCTVVGSPTLTQDRKSYANCAYSFPGDTNNYFKVSFASDFDIAPTGAFSISLWFNGYSANGGDFEALFDKRNVTGTKKSDYHLALSDLNKPAFGGPFFPIVFAGAFVPNNQWHHLTGVYNNGVWKLYVDSVPLNTSSGTLISQSSADIIIGKSFNGKIDDIRFYDRALSAAEVQQLFLAPGSCAPNGIFTGDIKNTFTVYPVPVSDKLYISLPDGASMKYAVKIMNLTGQVVAYTEIDGESFVSVESLLSGTYLMILTSESGEQALRKFVKQ